MEVNPLTERVLKLSSSPRVCLRMCACIRVFPVAEVMEEVWTTAGHSGVSSTVHPGSTAHVADGELPGTRLSVTAHIFATKREITNGSFRISEHMCCHCGALLLLQELLNLRG